MGEMLASVIIPSRGGAGRLPALLTALAAQTHARWEAIVVIDGDVDGSAAVVAQYAHLPVRSIVFPENRGRVAALNAGHAAATGDVLIRCDDDLVPTPGYLACHVAQHGGEPVGAVGLSRNVLPDNYYARAYGRAADERHRRGAYQSDVPWRYWAGNVSVTRDTWERIGPYDPAYRAYGWEDVDYGYRLHQAGIPVRLAPELETEHRGAATTARVRVLRAFHSGAAYRTFQDRHGQHLLPSAEPDGTGPWEHAVRLVGHQSRRRLTLLAGMVDLLGPALPRPLAEKAVALLVEGAAVAGHGRFTEVTTEL